MRTFLLMAVIVSSSGQIWAQSPVSKNPPEQQVARRGANGNWELVNFVTVCHVETEDYDVQRKITETVDGKTVEKTVTERKTRMVARPALQTMIQNLGKSFRVFETDGRQVDLETVPARVSKPTLVVVTRDGLMLAPYYATVFKPGTLIFAVSPAAESPRAVSQSEVTVSEVPQPAEGEKPPGKAEGQPAPVPGGDQPTLPPTLPPAFVFARIPEPDKINFRIYSERDREVAIQIDEVKNGKRTPSRMNQLRKATHSISTQLDLNQVAIATADSKPVDAQRARTLLKQALTVVASNDGEPVAPFWLTNLRPGTLVVTPPAGTLTPPEPPGPDSVAPSPGIFSQEFKGTFSGNPPILGR